MVTWLCRNLYEHILIPCKSVGDHRQGKNITINYGPGLALRDVSLAIIDDGEIVDNLCRDDIRVYQCIK